MIILQLSQTCIGTAIKHSQWTFSNGIHVDKYLFYSAYILQPAICQLYLVYTGFTQLKLIVHCNKHVLVYDNLLQLVSSAFNSINSAELVSE